MTPNSSSLTLHFVYLRPEAQGARGRHLHRFFHPKSLEKDQQALIVCSSLELSHPVFARLRARDFSEKGSRSILLRYEFVDSMLEVRANTGQLGLVDIETIRDELEEEKKGSRRLVWNEPAMVPPAPPRGSEFGQLHTGFGQLQGRM